jgi:hypothetical protein
MQADEARPDLGEREEPTREHEVMRPITASMPTPAELGCPAALARQCRQQLCLAIFFCGSLIHCLGPRTHACTIFESSVVGCDQFLAV